MSLNFPNARLFIHNLLSTDKLSGSEAIARGACEYGLIPPECVEQVQQATSCEPCKCMATAKNVFSKYFEKRAKQQKIPALNISEICSALEIDTEFYKQKYKLEPIVRCNTGVESHDCTKFAPVLFDLMLQQIMRYP